MSPETEYRVEEKNLTSVYGIERSLGRVEGKLDVLLEKFASHADDDLIAFGKIHDRISHLERRLYYFTGIGAAILVFVQFILPNLNIFVTPK